MVTPHDPLRCISNNRCGIQLQAVEKPCREIMIYTGNPTSTIIYMVGADTSSVP